MVTARGEHEYIKKGFLSGIDDYMIKPVDEEEMLLRINALLRRAKIARDKKIIINDAVLDYASLTVSDDKNSILLPPKEFYLLFKLLAYPGQIFTKNQLMDEIWGKESYTDPITVNVHINRLRKKFAGWKQFEIITIRGLGYKGLNMSKKNKISKSMLFYLIISSILIVIAVQLIIIVLTFVFLHFFSVGIRDTFKTVYYVEGTSLILIIFVSIVFMCAFGFSYLIFKLQMRPINKIKNGLINLTKGKFNTRLQMNLKHQENR